MLVYELCENGSLDDRLFPGNIARDSSSVQIESPSMLEKKPLHSLFRSLSLLPLQRARRRL